MIEQNLINEKKTKHQKLVRSEEQLYHCIVYVVQGQ